MSSTSEAAQIIAIYDSYRTSAYIGFAAVVFLLYDCVLTFDREVALFWTGRANGATALFFTIKYGTVLYNVLSCVSFIPDMSSKGCVIFRLVRFAALVEYLRFFPFAVFSGMRAYALTRNWALGAIVLILSLTPFVINMTQYGQGVRGELDPIIGCLEDLKFTPTEAIMWVVHSSDSALNTHTEYRAPNHSFPVVSRAGLIVADFLLVVVTWRTLASGPLRPHFRARSSRSLTDTMLWNGMSYFTILTILNVLHLAFSVANIASDGAVSTSYITIFTDPLTTILVCRFLLDLQNASTQDVKLGTDDPLHLSTAMGQTSLTFARVLGSVAATIVPVGELEDDRDSSEAESGARSAARVLE
ncbi:hypothetical protein L227DRAFT_608299 [Lentinus tigrinus ALCF2SS1-6]|uniref:DUF6533 domain-containing protein n=1 Tax=Lentinus tigrinus ALCF2SS1-6 TaxID=1328759 RepID=A0A5C2SJG9_9APHY|nr:hypothetical protein L227DRAFT_608299 [Lentinus tigrinus ALCF2SS1-6]